MTQTREAQIEKLDADLARINAERKALSDAAAERETKLARANSASQAARIAVVLDPTPAAEKRAAACKAEVDSLLNEESDYLDRDQLLRDAVAALQAQRTALALETEQGRIEAAKVALAERLKLNAPAFRAYITDVVALHGLKRDWLWREHVADAAYAACGAPVGQLLDEGKARVTAIRTGKEVIQ